MTHLEQCMTLNTEDPEAFRANALEMYNLAAKSGHRDVTEYIDDIVVTMHRRKTLMQCMRVVNNDEFRDNAYLFLKEACRRGDCEVAYFIIKNVPKSYNWCNLMRVAMRSGNTELCDMLNKHTTVNVQAVEKWTPLAVCKWLVDKEGPRRRGQMARKYMFQKGLEYARVDICAAFADPHYIKGRIVRTVLESQSPALLAWLASYCPTIKVNIDDLVYAIRRCSYKECRIVYNLWEKNNDVTPLSKEDTKKLVQVYQRAGRVQPFDDRSAELIEKYCREPSKSWFSYLKFW